MNLLLCYVLNSNKVGDHVRTVRSDELSDPTRECNHSTNVGLSRTINLIGGHLHSCQVGILVPGYEVPRLDGGLS